MVIRLPTDCRELLERQRGVLARWQASSCGLDVRAIDALLRQGRWQAMYRGVYASYTGTPSRESVLWAAVRRCGEDAVLSHHTAAELDGLSDQPSHAVHVTIPAHLRARISATESVGGLPRIVPHRSARIAQARHPARTPPRTRVEETVLDLADLAGTSDGAFGWVNVACSRRLVTPDQLRLAVGRRSKLRWRAEILGALDEVSNGVLSALERGYLRHVERPHGLPRAERQVRVDRGATSAYLDNLYADFAVAVELDGRAAHPTEARWRDIHRDNYFASTGIVTLRYSWADVTTRPCQVAMEVALVLRERGWTGTLRSCGASCAAAAT